MAIISLNEIYEKEKRMHYWCNACGEINLPDDPDPLTIHHVDELPERLRPLYDTYWSEGSGFQEYVVTVDGRDGMAMCFLLSNSYRDNILSELGLYLDICETAALHKKAVHKVAEWLSSQVPVCTDILVGIDTDPDGHELLVFVPAKHCESVYEKLGRKLDGLVFSKYEELYRQMLNGKCVPGTKFSFSQLVSFLDSLKTIWYQCMFVRDAVISSSPELMQTAQAVQKDIEAAADLPLSDAISRLMDMFPQVENTYPQGAEYRELDPKTELGQFVANFMEEFSCSDTTFYDEARYGEFWNEVELPAAVECLFNKVTTAAKEIYPDIIYPVGDQEGFQFRDGNCAVSIYDLSDVIVAFPTWAQATAFLEEESIEPSDKMSFSGGCWFCQ